MHRLTWVALAGIVALLVSSIVPGVVLGARPLPLGSSFEATSESAAGSLTRTVAVSRADAEKKFAAVTAELTLRDAAGAVLVRAADDLVVNRESTYPETAQPQQLRLVEPAWETPQLEREGLTYFFPAETEKRSYPYFDPVLRFSTPIDYLREDTVGGLGGSGGVKAYTFAQDIPAQKISWWGQPPRNGDAAQFYTPAERARFGFAADTHVVLEPYYGVRREVSVDPFTGTVVDVHEDVWCVWATDAQQAQVRDVAPDKRSIFIGDLRWDDATRARALESVTPRVRLQSQMAALAWVGKALGVLALGYAAYGFLKRRRGA